MTLSQFRFVNAVAESQSFSKAAQRCNVTQPTLSNGIAQLERTFGARIFERTTRTVALTPFGRHVLPMIKGVLEARDELDRGVAAYLNPSLRLVRIGCSPLVDIGLLTTVLDPYRRQSAEVEVFFKECFLNDLDERLDDEKLDLIVRPVVADGPAKIHQVGIPFYDEPLYYLPCAGPAGRESEPGPVRLDAIAGEHFALTHDGCGLAPATRRLFAAQGYALKEYPGQALSYQVLQDWAGLGIAAAILPERKLTPEHRDKGRIVLIDGDVPARLHYETVWKRNAASTPHVAALHEHFRATVPKLVSGAAA